MTPSKFLGGGGTKYHVHKCRWERRSLLRQLLVEIPSRKLVSPDIDHYIPPNKESHIAFGISGSIFRHFLRRYLLYWILPTRRKNIGCMRHECFCISFVRHKGFRWTSSSPTQQTNPELLTHTQHCLFGFFNCSPAIRFLVNPPQKHSGNSSMLTEDATSPSLPWSAHESNPHFDNASK